MTLLGRRNLQRRFTNNMATLCRRLLIDVFFAILLQRRNMVERRRDLKTTTSSRRRVSTGYKSNINNTSLIILFNRQLSYFLMAFSLDQDYFLGDFGRL